MSETTLRLEAERRHPNHTYARGKFIEGGRYQAEQYMKDITKVLADTLEKYVMDRLPNGALECPCGEVMVEDDVIGHLAVHQSEAVANVYEA